jgi:hypothetical protein
MTGWLDESLVHAYREAGRQFSFLGQTCKDEVEIRVVSPLDKTMDVCGT